MSKLQDIIRKRAAAIDACVDYKRLPPVDAKIACACCGAGRDKSAEDFLVAVGFGSAGVSKNGMSVIEEQEAEHIGEEIMLSMVEAVAAAESPPNDWRIHLHGPLSGQEYQRQGDGHWVLVHRDEGFA